MSSCAVPPGGSDHSTGFPSRRAAKFMLALHLVAVLSFSPVLLATLPSRYAPLAHLSNLAHQHHVARLPRCYIAASEERPALSDAVIVDAFREFDTSGDGFIDLAELDAALSKAGMPVSSTAAADILKSADANSDGQISLEEFKEVFKLSEVPSELQPLMVCVRGVCVLPEAVDCDVEALEDGECSPVDFWWPRALLLACSVSYGANFPAGKIAYEAVDPAVASCLRFALASIVLSPFLLQAPRIPSCAAYSPHLATWARQSRCRPRAQRRSASYALWRSSYAPCWTCSTACGSRGRAGPRRRSP